MFSHKSSTVCIYSVNIYLIFACKVLQHEVAHSLDKMFDCGDGEILVVVAINQVEE